MLATLDIGRQALLQRRQVRRDQGHALAGELVQPIAHGLNLGIVHLEELLEHVGGPLDAHPVHLTLAAQYRPLGLLQGQLQSATHPLHLRLVEQGRDHLAALEVDPHIALQPHQHAFAAGASGQPVLELLLRGDLVRIEYRHRQGDQISHLAVQRSQFQVDTGTVDHGQRIQLGLIARQLLAHGKDATVGLLLQDTVHRLQQLPGRAYVLGRQQTQRGQAQQVLGLGQLPVCPGVTLQIRQPLAQGLLTALQVGDQPLLLLPLIGRGQPSRRCPRVFWFWRWALASSVMRFSSWLSVLCPAPACCWPWYHCQPDSPSAATATTSASRAGPRPPPALRGLFRVREAVFLSAAAALCSAPGVTAALAAGALSSGLVFWLLSFFDSTLFPLWRDWVRAYRGEHAVVIGTITDHDVGAAQLCGKRRHPRSRHPAAPVPLLLPGGSGGLTPVLQRLTTEYDYSPTIPGQRRQSVSQTRGLRPAIQLQQIHPATGLADGGGQVFPTALPPPDQYPQIGQAQQLIPDRQTQQRFAVLAVAGVLHGQPVILQYRSSTCAHRKPVQPHRRLGPVFIQSLQAQSCGDGADRHHRMVAVQIQHHAALLGRLLQRLDLQQRQTAGLHAQLLQAAAQTPVVLLRARQQHPTHWPSASRYTASRISRAP